MKQRSVAELVKLRIARTLLSLIMLAAVTAAASRVSLRSKRHIRPSIPLAFANQSFLARPLRKNSETLTVRYLSSNAPKRDDDRAESQQQQPFAEWDAIFETTSGSKNNNRSPSFSSFREDWGDDDDDNEDLYDAPPAPLQPVSRDKPPPRARAMPPVLESYESSNSFGEDLGSTVDDFGAFDYQPHLYDDEASALATPDESLFPDDIPPQSAEWDETVQTPSPPKETRSMPPRSSFHGTASVAASDRNSIYKKGAGGDAVTSTVDMLKSKLDQLEQEIYAQNNGHKFNINSHKQVSLVLFGEIGQSTNKEVLEAMGGAGNRMADLILQYRQCARAIAREEKREEVRSKGRNVKSMSTRSANETPAAATSSDLPYDDDPLLLVDTSAYIFRAYYSMPPLHRSDGMPIGAVLGFCNMLNRLVLNRLLEGERPRLVLVFDSKGKTFRHELYDDYKANRPECPMDLIPQFDLVREAAKAYGIHQLEAPSYEADDVIATLASIAKSEGVDASILSSDKDLMQLVTAENETPAITMIDPITMSRITHDAVVEKWGVEPRLVGDVLALAGDSSDNIPGVKGIGPKIAASLLQDFGNLDNLLERLDEVKQKARREKMQANIEMAKLSRQLVELERGIPLANMTFPEDMANVSDLRMEPMNRERLLDFFETMGFRDLKRRFQNRLDQLDRKRPRKNNKRPKATIPQPEEFEDVPF